LEFIGRAAEDLDSSDFTAIASLFTDLAAMQDPTPLDDHPGLTEAKALSGNNLTNWREHGRRRQAINTVIADWRAAQ
jgi:hypothetical protein